jgi:hypothetical protein
MGRHVARRKLQDQEVKPCIAHLLLCSSPAHRPLCTRACMHVSIRGVGTYSSSGPTNKSKTTRTYLTRSIKSSIFTLVTLPPLLLFYLGLASLCHACENVVPKASF